MIVPPTMTPATLSVMPKSLGAVVSAVATGSDVFAVKVPADVWANVDTAANASSHTGAVRVVLLALAASAVCLRLLGPRSC